MAAALSVVEEGLRPPPPGDAMTLDVKVCLTLVFIDEFGLLS